MPCGVSSDTNSDERPARKPCGRLVVVVVVVVVVVIIIIEIWWLLISIN